MDDGSVVLASKDYRIYVYRYLMTSSSIGTNGGGGGGLTGNNTTPSSSPISSSSTTPNSSQMLGGECTSPSLMNGHGESPPITSNGF